MRKRAKSASFFKKLLWVLIPAFSLALMSGLFFGADRRPAVTPEQEVRRAVEDINNRITSVKLEPSYVVFDGVPRPKFQYMLTILPTKGETQDAVYLFDKYEYTITTGADTTKVPTAQLCKLVDSVYDRKDPILEALRDLKASGKVSFPVWKFGGEVELGNVTPILVEMLYALRRFHELQTTHPEIMVRGYADGQHRPWERPLDADYFYDSIPVYPALEPRSKNPAIYVKEESPVNIQGSNYRNEHLPDLRAQFVKKDLVEPYFNLCRELKPEAHILKGFEFKDLKDKPLERKVQVFILIYEN